MPSPTDSIYQKLRPPSPTPLAEICRCSEPYPVMLQPHLSYNPVSCIACNLEVPPERLRFSASVVEQIAHWRDFHDCFYRLWLDSAEFEAWAQAQLESADSPVTQRGRAVAGKMNAYRRTYYWWFQADQEKAMTNCPVCSASLTTQFGRMICDPCSIVFPKSAE